jgi:hypothetical protein
MPKAPFSPSKFWPLLDAFSLSEQFVIVKKRVEEFCRRDFGSGTLDRLGK